MNENRFKDLYTHGQAAVRPKDRFLKIEKSRRLSQIMNKSTHSTQFFKNKAIYGIIDYRCEDSKKTWRVQKAKRAPTDRLWILPENSDHRPQTNGPFIEEVHLQYCAAFKPAFDNFKSWTIM
jgi:hypothetical protein